MARVKDSNKENEMRKLYKKRKTYDLTTTEVKMNLVKSGIVVRPSYKHDDYITPSFSMPYTTKAKLDKVCKKFGLSKSSLVTHLIEKFVEVGS